MSTHEVYDVAWHRFPGTPHVVLTHKTHGPAQWQTVVHTQYRLRVPRAVYLRIVRECQRARRHRADAERLAYERLLSEYRHDTSEYRHDTL